MDVFGYIRVSTQDEVDSGLSLDSQRQRISEFCSYKGFNLVEIIEDQNVSASIPLGEREGGARLLQCAESAVVAVRLDRLFRDAHDCLGVTKVWNKQGIALHLLDLGVDTSSAMGRAFLTNAATYAELERNLISERTREALAQIKRKGGSLGAAPLGYTHQRGEDGTVQLVKVKDEHDAVKLCRKLREDGLTLQQVADHLNGKGIPTKRGARWYPSTVRNYCSSPSSSTSR